MRCVFKEFYNSSRHPNMPVRETHYRKKRGFILCLNDAWEMMGGGGEALQRGPSRIEQLEYQNRAVKMWVQIPILLEAHWINLGTDTLSQLNLEENRINLTK